MKTSILFVCMGNICRSPTAEGVMLKLLADAGLDAFAHVESAGTHASHIGEAPDARAQKAALKRGYDLSRLGARRVQDEDFERFDLILAMDWDNLSLLQDMAPAAHQRKLHLLMRFATAHDAQVVPDPYYGGSQGFELVLNYCEDACKALVDVVRRRAAAADLA